ncbi:MAG TPA: hypothetical protein VD861_03970, partial [Pyrinomonadaceae bacterium]|nr:hypothetical protein [Pyrinomonadaceae bacterium]
MAALLMLSIPKRFTESLVDRLGLIQATLLSAVLALLLAILLSGIVALLWIKFPSLKESWGAYARILPAGMRDVLRKASAKLALVIAAVAVVLYFALPGTHLWKLARLYWSGPQVDLASPAREKSFQSTINLPWFTYGQDFGVVPGWTWQGVSQNRAALDAAFAQLRRSGVKCVAWFLLSDGRGAPSFDSRGNVTGLDQSFWQDYDAAIEVARKHEVGILWVLIDFHWLAPARQENGATLFGHADVITDDAKRESFFQQALIPILRRHPLEPQIVGWVLINEPENALKEAALTSDQLSEFTRRASALIKKYTYGQPVSVGSVDLESLMEYWGRNSDGLDFLVFHHYEKFLTPPADYVRAWAPGAGGKPIYIGEF